jgi:hypothetical protein
MKQKGGGYRGGGKTVRRAERAEAQLRELNHDHDDV